MAENKKEKRDPKKRALEVQFAIRKAMDRVKHKVLVLSGKGGVGKSTVAVNLAFGFARSGYKVGLLDIDIHGPSIGKMTGIEGQYLTGDGETITPLEVDGVKIITMASLLPPGDTPVIWRGPMKMQAIDQFLSEIDWGDLDMLVIDSPPGTGDEPLSIIQRLPEMDGAVIVSTPQDVALSDARRTVNFSQKLDIPVLGVIENMSGFRCPHCGEVTDIFKKGGGEKAAGNMELDFLGSLPIEPAVMAASDTGKPFVLESEGGESRQRMLEIVETLEKKIGLSDSPDDA